RTLVCASSTDYDARASTPSVCSSLPFIRHPRPPRPTPFPYTTLFRSRDGDRVARPRVGREPAAVRGGRRVRRSLRGRRARRGGRDRKSTRLNSSHGSISYAVFCLKKNKRLPARAHPRADDVRSEVTAA